MVVHDRFLNQCNRSVQILFLSIYCSISTYQSRFEEQPETKPEGTAPRNQTIVNIKEFSFHQSSTMHATRESLDTKTAREPPPTLLEILFNITSSL